MAAVKDNRPPDTKNLEGLIDVVVRSSIGVLRIVQIGIAIIGARIGIHAVGPGILRFRGERMRELMLETGEHHVVIRLTLAAEVVDAIYQGVQWRPNDVSESVRVIVVQGVMTGT